jgi:DNA-binding MarR family transcriptional regulator
MATEVCLAARARRLNRVLSALYDDRLREVGISIGQLDMLVTLMYAGAPTRPIDLAREMQMERSTVTRNLAKLEASGVVELRSGEGKRERLIIVTRKGRRVVAHAEAGWTDAQHKARVLLGERGVRGLEVASERVARATAH